MATQIKLYSYIWVIYFCISFLFCNLFSLILPASLKQDSPTDYENIYLPVGRNIYEGKGIFDSNGTPASRTPPGFPIIISGILWACNYLNLSYSSTVIFLMKIGFGISTVILYSISRKIWAPKFSWIPPLLWCTYPFALWLSLGPNVEIPFIICLLSSIYFWWIGITNSVKNKYYFLFSGFFLGLAMLCRPIALLVGPVFIIIYLFTLIGKKRLGQLLLPLLFLVGMFIPILPWEIWIFNQTGKVILLSTADSSSVNDGLTFAIDSKGYRSDFGMPERIKNLMKDFSYQETKMTSLVDIGGIVWTEIIRKPITVIEFFLIKAIRGWYGTDSGRGENITSLIQIPYITLIILGFYFCFRNGHNLKLFAIYSAGLIGYFWAMSILVVPILRYIVPVLSVAFLLIPGMFILIKENLLTNPALKNRIRSVITQLNEYPL